ncbi:MAG: DEAD/DEAH box helicase [Actinomycetota bacterium]
MSRNTFRDLGVPADLTTILERRDIRAPFPIQAATLPDALAGRDICGRAPTGSGKTLAFGLALAMRTPRAQNKRPTALVLVPTRELAAQVERELKPLADARKLRVATVYGGVGYQPQRNALRRGVEILVACPGRLEDLLEQRELSLNDVSAVVVDEADRMADMGFLPAVKRLLDQTRKDRQTMLFSATLDGDVDVLIRRYQKDPKRHQVATSEEKQGDVSHMFWRAERDERVQLTAQLIGTHKSAMVFCRTRHGADRLAKQLTRSGIEAAAIHGGRSQPQRDAALRAFTTGRARALIATDVAARGIHVDNVSVIVHFDPPTTHKDYVHRSGRTGRAGADGKVVSLVSRDSAADVRQIQKALRMPPRLDHPDVSSLGPKIQIAQRPAMETHPAAEKKKQHGEKKWRHPGEKGRRPGQKRRRPQQMRRTG